MHGSVPHPFLVAEHIYKSFADIPVLKGVDLTIAAGETVCLLGPSGCGKTTLLRVVAGLEPPDAGRVFCQGEDVTEVPVHRREFGLMFQDYALFPHMSAFDNIAFGLRMHHWPPQQIRQRVVELLTLVNLQRYGQRKVYELSGGQQQRVALVRSLAPKPRLLMLDEPLGSLDRVLRDRLQDELRALLGQLRQTALYVTHDQWEAFAIADRIVLMNEGGVEQVGTPDAIYLRPASLFASRFLGFRNEFPARITALNPAPALDGPLGVLHPVGLPPQSAVGDAVTVVIRPEAATLHHDACGNRLALRLVDLSFRGAQMIWRLIAPGTEQVLEFYLPPQPRRPPVGDMVSVCIEPQGIVVFAG